jgi:carboxyl-terminal processing protease
MKKIFKISIVSLAILLGLSAFDSTNERYFEIAKNLDIFATLFKEVNTYYVDEINPTTFMEDGIYSMLAKLDPYTNYIPEDRIEDYRTMATGQYAGVGASINRVEDRLLITMPFEGFAAQRAGVLAGDEILEIDDIKIKGKKTAEVSKLLKGQAGTEIKLVLKRFGEDNPLNISIIREKIKINSVSYYGMINEDVGMISLTEFTHNAGREVRNALVDLKEKGATKIILDLRGNPGGLLNEAVNISNLFVPKDAEIVHTKGKIKEWNKTYKALNPAVDTEIPLAVLLNRGSASASEIVAGVIQDYDRGILIGNRSYGKGLVQTTLGLSYNSQLKVTVAKYYIPSGRCIQAIDYSNRNEDGSVGKIPDSLRVAFKTQNGREVFDGGGVMPDVEVEDFNVAPITQSLYMKNLLFDYATQYHSKHKEIATAKDFKLSDAEYQEFTSWLEGKEYDYTTSVEKALEKLKEYSKTEESYARIKEQIEALSKSVSHNKKSDLEAYNVQIRDLLEAEISTRYYFEKGGIESSFDNDPDVAQAIKLLNDSEEYEKILKGA